MNKVNELIDIRFAFIYDKLSNNTTQINLKKYMKDHSEDFREVNWIEDSRCYNIPNLRYVKVFNKNINKKLADNNEIMKNVIKYFNSLDSEVKLDDNLNNYIKLHINSLVGGKTSSQCNNTSQNFKSEFINSVEESHQINKLNTPEDINTNYNITNKSNYNFINTNDISTYSLASDHQLSYEDVCKLTIAIARSKLTLSDNYKDETILQAEEQKRIKLREELNKYMKLSQIASEIKSSYNADINDLNLKQLEYYSTEAKKMYEKLKVVHLVSQGIDGFDKVYNTVFKNGIKIPQTNKSIKINNIGGALKQVIFDRKSPFYVGFENLLDKYHINISDEFLAITLLGSTIIKNVEIVDNEPRDNSNDILENNNDNNIQKESDESANESFIEQSYDASDDN